MVLSQKVTEQYDYKIVMNMIDKALNTSGPNGSISVGKYYASKYKEKINNMLCEEELNVNILNEMLDTVDKDLIDVRSDCNRRIRSHLTDSNNNMMSMIIDFVKSI
jgi:hypothetical protein